MKLVANKILVEQLLAEVLLEYKLHEANPFAAAAEKEGGGEEGGGDAEADAGGEEEKKDDKESKPKEGGDALTVKFNQSAVKKYNTNKDWKADSAEVKKITKNGLEVDINGSTILINFNDITSE